MFWIIFFLLLFIESDNDGICKFYVRSAIKKKDFLTFDSHNFVIDIKLIVQPVASSFLTHKIRENKSSKWQKHKHRLKTIFNHKSALNIEQNFLSFLSYLVCG